MRVGLDPYSDQVSQDLRCQPHRTHPGTDFERQLAICADGFESGRHSFERRDDNGVSQIGPVETGPDFILRPMDAWPESPAYLLPPEAKEEMKTEKIEVEQFHVQEAPTQTDPWPWEKIMERSFNSFNKLVTAVSLCQRYVRILYEVSKGQRKRPKLLTRKEETLEKRFERQTGRIRIRIFDPPIKIPKPSNEERLQAEKTIFMAVQGLHLQKISADLRQHGKVNHTHPLAKATA
jgi:hypothetical protein